MSALTMLAPLLDNVELTPGQLAELRAIDIMYQSRIAGDPDASSTSRLALDELVLARVREMLHDDQRVRFDRNRGAHHGDEARGRAHTGRCR